MMIDVYVCEGCGFVSTHLSEYKYWNRHLVCKDCYENYKPDLIKRFGQSPEKLEGER